jgi:hypothetical protein
MLSGSWRQFAVLVSHVIIRAGDILGRCIMGNHPREPLTHDCIIRHVIDHHTVRPDGGMITDPSGPTILAPALHSARSSAEVIGINLYVLLTQCFRLPHNMLTYPDVLFVTEWYPHG